MKYILTKDGVIKHPYELNLSSQTVELRELGEGAKMQLTTIGLVASELIEADRSTFLFTSDNKIYCNEFIEEES